MKSIKRFFFMSKLVEQRGAVVVLVAIMGVVFIGLIALAVDLSHLYVVRNELQNAADAGALAGARVLYNDTGTSINPGANEEAYDAAIANKAISKSGTISVDVKWSNTDPNDENGDVQRGHWSFGLGDLPKGFYYSDNTTPPILWGKSTVELDEDQNFVNAVKVVARRGDGVDDTTNAASFFAKIFGFDDFILSADAVGYIGFAGTLKPNDVDLPIALCQESLLDENGEYSCSFGRMLNGGSNAGDHNTGEWTNYTQDDKDTSKDECKTAEPTDLRSLLTGCSSGNPKVISYGQSIGGTAGVQANLIDNNNPSQLPNITTCWKDGTNTITGMPKIPWTVTLPVIKCPKNTPTSCQDSVSPVVGSVTVNILWILLKENDIDNDAPREMYNPETGQTWENTSSDGIVRWNSFVDEFGLQMPISDTEFGPAYYSSAPQDNGFKQKSIYFMPDCTPHAPGGLTGGVNFGTLAEIPVLVE